MSPAATKTAAKPKAKPRARRAKASKPFTIDHFRSWASGLVLDNDERWTLEDFQADFATDLFEGFTVVWLVVPEGNGKTTLAAGLALYACEFKPFSSIPVAASSREQAETLYRQAEGFVIRTPALHELCDSGEVARPGKRTRDVPRFDCLEGYRRINHINGSRIQVFAADDRHGDGVIPTLAIIDELHRHKNLALYRTWLGKMEKRKGQIIVISTAGEPGGEFEEAREQMRHAEHVERMGGRTIGKSANGVIHDWSVAEDGDPEDLDVVAEANPFSGVTAETLARKRELPGMTLAHWRRFTCNLPTRADSAAITEAEWFAAFDKDGIPEGVPIWAGLDLGWKFDTTALVPLWVRDNEHRVFGHSAILTPPRDGTMLSPHLIEDAIMKLHQRNPIQAVVMDMTDGAQLATWIEGELGITVIDRLQRSNLQSQDYSRFTEALRLGWLKHSGDQTLTRHVLNAIAVMLPGGQMKFERPHRGRSVTGALAEARVIDGLVAAAMVHTVATAAEEEVQVWGMWG